MKNTVNKTFKALELAAARHRNQVRKGTEKTPYINHPINVISILTEFHETDPDILAAAALHDVIEDTAKGQNEINQISAQLEELFGKRVLDIVLEVSDDKELPYQKRKELQITKTPSLSPAAKKLKIADKICNIKDMIADPPTSWPTERKITYLEWSRKVIQGARGVNPELEAYFDQIVEESYIHLTNK